jgi:hypothetical protein
MANHVERMLETTEHHTCGRCGWVLPSHGAYVMHDCAGLLEAMPDDRSADWRFLVPRWQAPCWLGRLTPVPVRLVELWAAQRAMGLRRPVPFVVPDRITGPIERRREWGISPFRALHEAAADLDMTSSDVRRYMAMYTHPIGIEP